MCNRKGKLWEVIYLPSICSPEVFSNSTLGWTYPLRPVKTSEDSTLRFCHFYLNHQDQDDLEQELFWTRWSPAIQRTKHPTHKPLGISHEAQAAMPDRLTWRSHRGLCCWFFFFLQKIKRPMSFISLSPLSRGKKRDTICSPSGTSTWLDVIKPSSPLVNNGWNTSDPQLLERKKKKKHTHTHLTIDKLPRVSDPLGNKLCYEGNLAPKDSLNAKIKIAHCFEAETGPLWKHQNHIFGGSLYFLLQTLFGSHRSFLQLLFLVITGTMPRQAAASAGQVWVQGVRVRCLERQES